VSLRPCSAAGAPDRDSPSFTVRLDLIAGRVEVAGLLDRTTAHLFHDAISTLILADCPLWTVDVTELTTCEGMGLHSIGIAYRRALRENRRFRLVGTPPWLRQELTRLHLGHLLHGGLEVGHASDVATTGAEPDGGRPHLSGFQGPRR
jgi:anti-anti-sigma regulatory factor